MKTIVQLVYTTSTEIDCVNDIENSFFSLIRITFAIGFLTRGYLCGIMLLWTVLICGD